MTRSIRTAPRSRDTYLRLLSYVRPYWKVFSVALFAMVATAALEPLLPALLKALFDSGFQASAKHPFWYFPALLLGLFLIRGVAGFVADYAMAWVSSKLVFDLRSIMFARLVQLPAQFFDDSATGIIVSKLTYDVSSVTSAATSALTTMVRDSITICGLLAWLFFLNWKLTFIAISVAPLIALVVRYLGRRLRQLTRKAQRTMGKITHVLEESVGAHRVIKMFGGQQYEINRFGAVNREQRGLAMRQTVAAAAQGPFVQLLTALALALIISTALQQSAADQTTVGTFVGFITAVIMLLAPIKRLTEVNAPLQRGLAGAESVFELIDEPLEKDIGARKLDRSIGHVTFENVSFSYPGSNRNALDEINIDIAPGMTVALVGRSGSGKTTIANLIPRFYAVTRGRILIDGHDIKDVPLADLRANIATVSQDVLLFNDTVAANIAYGAMCDASHETIVEAARAAHALEFIQAMPGEFDALVGERGNKLSGGQRQRLAIARAILKDAPILILDEATSALDNESERAVQVALAELMKRRTTLVIAHRLSTIEQADLIAVLADGRVVESGTHRELLAREAEYAQLYRLQFRL